MKYIYIILILPFQLCSSAQDCPGSKGSFFDLRTGEVGYICYTRIVQNIADIYSSAYTVSKLDGKDLFRLEIIVDKKSRSITINAKYNNSGSSTSRTLLYQDDYSLFFVKNNTFNDTLIDSSYSYSILFSIPNTSEPYVSLNQFTSSEDNLNYRLEKFRLTYFKKHLAAARDYYSRHQLINLAIEQQRSEQIELEQKRRIDSLTEVIKKLSLATPGSQKGEIKISPQLTHTGNPDSLKSKEVKDTFNDKLMLLCKAFYSGYNSDSITVFNYRQKINNDIVRLTPKPLERDYPDEEVIDYAGGKDNKKNPSGEGLMVLDGKNVYDGTFLNGKFKEGIAVVRNKRSEYCGNYLYQKPNGLGWEKILNVRNFKLGKFVNGSFDSGIILEAEKSEDPGYFRIYFGSYQNGGKNGYGEYETKGEAGFGQFSGGILRLGYVRQVDQFGYITLYRIDNGFKSAVTIDIAKPFFDTLSGLKMRH